MIISKVIIIIAIPKNNPIFIIKKKMQRLFDIKKTQLELVQDRGYVVSPQEMAIFTMTLEEFTNYVNTMVVSQKKSARTVLSKSYDMVNDNGEVIRKMEVFYAGKEKKYISSETVNEFIKRLTPKVYEAILIVNAPLSAPSSKELSAVHLTRWQIFNDSDLSYNPIRHVDTPRHELLSPEETQAKLKEMRVDMSKLLIIKVNDPVIRYYGWPVGGLVRVHRDDRAISILAPKSVNYRVIVG